MLTLYLAIMIPHNQTQKEKSSSNVFSPEIASCIWVGFTPKKKLTNLVMKKWISFLVINEAKLSVQIVQSLGKSIINMYSMGACTALRISNQGCIE